MGLTDQHGGQPRPHPKLASDRFDGCLRLPVRVQGGRVDQKQARELNESRLDAESDPIREEVLTAYEAGIKATLAGGDAQLNVAAFFYDYKDKQEQDRAVTFVGKTNGSNPKTSPTSSKEIPA